MHTPKQLSLDNKNKITFFFVLSSLNRTFSYIYKRITFEGKRIMTEINKTEQEERKSLNFIEQRVKADLAEGKNGGRLQTRFPPEPNG